MMKKKIRLLFIGNSHTYVNSLPAIVADMALGEGVECEVTMIAHGGWFLEQHTKEPDVPFNIRYGNYDYVILQEHAHPFGPVEKFHDAVRTLNGWICESGSKAVIYMTWAQKSEPFLQKMMSDAHETIASEIGALLAPVGNVWWQYLEEHPEEELYYTDGQHASLKGSTLAARVIWDTIKKDREGIQRKVSGI